MVDARVFDLFVGQGVPEGHKSLAVEVVLQPGEKTYTDEDLEGDRRPDRRRRDQVGGRRCVRKPRAALLAGLLAGCATSAGCSALRNGARLTGRGWRAALGNWQHGRSASACCSIRGLCRRSSAIDRTLYLSSCPKAASTDAEGRRRDGDTVTAARWQRSADRADLASPAASGGYFAMSLPIGVARGRA